MFADPGTVLYTIDNVQDTGLRLRTDLATPGANVPDAGLELRTDLAAPTGAGLMGYGQTTTYAAGTVGQRLERVINVADAPYNAKADGTGATGTDQSTAFQAALDDLNTRGGGGLFIPWAPLCYWAQGLTVHSKITLYSDTKSTCVQKPSGGGLYQMFTSNTANALTDVHFNNFTIDGNKANQTGFPAHQNGVDDILFEGCSNCSATNMVIENAITDGIEIDGSGGSAVTTVANAVDATATVTGATWFGGVATYTTSAPHGMGVTGVNVYVTVSGVNPSGWDQSAAQCTPGLNATTFSCPLASAPSAYVSGGTASWSTLVYVSGFPFTTLQTDAILNGGTAGACSVISRSSSPSTAVNCATEQGTQSNVTFTINGANPGVGDNLEIANNLITGNRRNGITHDCGTNTHIHNNHISYTAGSTGPWSGIDMEMDKLGCSTVGSTYLDNEIDHNAGSAISIAPETTYDPNFSPVILNLNSHDNSLYCVNLQGSFGPTSALTLSVNCQNDAAGGAFISWNGSNNVYIPWIVTGGTTPAGVVVNSTFGGGTIGGGTLSGTSADFLWSTLAGYQLPWTSGAALSHGSIAGTPGNYHSPVTVANNNNPTGCPFFTTSSPSSSVLATSQFCYVKDNGGANPDMFITNLNYSLTTGWSSAVTYAIGNIVQYSNGVYYYSLQNANTNQNPVTQTAYWQPECKIKWQSLSPTSPAAFFGSETNCPAVFGSNNATTGAAGSITVQASGGKTLVNVVDLPTSASGLATGTLWNNSGVINVAP